MSTLHPLLFFCGLWRCSTGHPSRHVMQVVGAKPSPWLTRAPGAATRYVRYLTSWLVQPSPAYLEPQKPRSFFSLLFSLAILKPLLPDLGPEDRLSLSITVFTRILHSASIRSGNQPHSLVRSGSQARELAELRPILMVEGFYTTSQLCC